MKNWNDLLAPFLFLTVSLHSQTAPAAAQRQPQGTLVRAIVFGPELSFVRDAWVELQDTGRGVSFAAVTDVKGQAEWRVPEGNYRLIARFYKIDDVKTEPIHVGGAAPMVIPVFLDDDDSPFSGSEDCEFTPGLVAVSASGTGGVPVPAKLSLIVKRFEVPEGCREQDEKWVEHDVDIARDEDDAQLRESGQFIMPFPPGEYEIGAELPGLWKAGPIRFKLKPYEYREIHLTGPSQPTGRLKGYWILDGYVSSNYDKLWLENGASKRRLEFSMDVESRTMSFEAGFLEPGTWRMVREEYKKSTTIAENLPVVAGQQTFIGGTWKLAYNEPMKPIQPNGKGGLEVWVTDEKLHPLADVQVNLAGSGADANTCETDDDGKCEMVDLTPGTYDLLIETPGFESMKFRVVAIKKHALTSQKVALKYAVAK